MNKVDSDEGFGRERIRNAAEGVSRQVKLSGKKTGFGRSSGERTAPTRMAFGQEIFQVKGQRQNIRYQKGVFCSVFLFDLKKRLYAVISSGERKGGLKNGKKDTAV